MSRTWGDAFGYLMVATGRAEVMVDASRSTHGTSPASCRSSRKPVARSRISRYGDRLRRTLHRHQRRARGRITKDPMLDLNALDFEKGGGLVTVVAQDASSGRVLMVALRVARIARAHAAIRRDALSVAVAGALAQGRDQRQHAARREPERRLRWRRRARARRFPPAQRATPVPSTCFGRRRRGHARRTRRDDRRPRGAGGAEGSYTAKLLADRNLRLKKIGEEASEFVTACADGDASRANEEAADLLYHVLVALHAAGGSLAAVRDVLRARR